MELTPVNIKRDIMLVEIVAKTPIQLYSLPIPVIQMYIRKHKWVFTADLYSL